MTTDITASVYGRGKEMMPVIWRRRGCRRARTAGDARGRVMTDNARLIDTLNAALSEEWIAYYQQWVYAQMIRGPRHAEIRASLINRTHDECGLDHINTQAGAPVHRPQPNNRHKLHANFYFFVTLQGIRSTASSVSMWSICLAMTSLGRLSSSFRRSSSSRRGAGRRHHRPDEV